MKIGKAKRKRTAEEELHFWDNKLKRILEKYNVSETDMLGVFFCTSHIFSIGIAVGKEEE